jgi:hypothetical protein
VIIFCSDTWRNTCNDVGSEVTTDFKVAFHSGRRRKTKICFSGIPSLLAKYRKCVEFMGTCPRRKCKHVCSASTTSWISRVYIFRPSYQASAVLPNGISFSGGHFVIISYHDVEVGSFTFYGAVTRSTVHRAIRTNLTGFRPTSENVLISFHRGSHHYILRLSIPTEHLEWMEPQLQYELFLVTAC